MKAKHDPLLDVIGRCTGGDGRLTENIPEALSEGEAFPTEAGVASANQPPWALQRTLRPSNPNRKQPEKGESATDPKRTR